MSDFRFERNDLQVLMGLGRQGKLLGDNLYGINNNQSLGSALPSPQLGMGMVFFTRPQLNMTSGNIRAVREFTPLLTNEPSSINRWVRCTLDPRLALVGEHKGFYGLGKAPEELPKNEIITSPLVDKYNTFIPVLSNRVETITGWPDKVFPVFTSDEGIYKQTMSMVDGSSRIYGKVELNLTFGDVQGEPILRLFDTWGSYPGLAFEGIIQPYPDFWVEDEFDFHTRLFRILLDKNNRYVVKIASTGPAFVDTIGIGTGFDYNRALHFNEADGDLSVKITAHGIAYNDPVLLLEFNQTVEIGNAMMGDKYRDTYMERINPNVIKYFNYVGYPHIDLNDLSFSWYVDKRIAKDIMEKFLILTSGRMSYDMYSRELSDIQDKDMVNELKGENPEIGTIFT